VLSLVSVKKLKLEMFGELPLDSLKKICRIEKVSQSGKKSDIVKRLAGRVSLKKTRIYSSNLGLKEDFSIFKHKLVPKHRIMGEKEKGNLLKKYSVTLNQLPRIRVRDPAAMSIGAKVGDVLEITRKSHTAKELKYYRVVVRGRVK
jgi:DNA-directed RNA polymerase subunit H